MSSSTRLLKLLVESKSSMLVGDEPGSTCQRCYSRAVASVEASPAPAASRFHSWWARHASAC